MTNRDDWAEHAAARRKAENDLKPLNRQALFDVLTAAGITAATIEFNGAGDEGQIESILFFREDTEVPTPSADVIFFKLADGSLDSTPSTMPIIGALEDVAYDLLYESHEGWGDGDGAYGEFRFEIGTRSISLDFNARFTDSANFQHTF